MDGGAWRTVVYGVTKESDTIWQLSNNKVTFQEVPYYKFAFQGTKC